MNCPSCKTDPLTEVKIQKVHVDQCVGCGGFWFDKGEIGSYLHFSRDTPDCAGLMAKAREVDKECPHCAVRLKERPYVADSDLMIDFCPDCEGVWLDSGEIVALKGLAHDPENRRLRLMRAVWELRQKAGIADPMMCPKCSRPTLNELNTGEGVSVDFCGDCKGVWFERGELGRMVELSKDIPNLEDSLQRAQDTDFHCPRCRQALKEIQYAPMNNLKVDYCRGCQGIWLDAGELSTVEGLATILESPASRLGLAAKQLYEDGYISMQV